MQLSTQRFPIFRVLPVVLVGAGLLLLPALPARAVPLKYTLSFSVPFSGTVSDSGTMENVAISGSVMVKATFDATRMPIRVITKYTLSRAYTAVGATSGDTYRLTAPRVGFTATYASVPKTVTSVPVLCLSPSASPGSCEQVPVSVEFTVDPSTGLLVGSSGTIVAAPTPASCTTVVEICN